MSLALRPPRRPAAGVVSAAFASTHEGRYATLECLTVPSSCPSADGSVSTEPFLNRSAAEPGPRGPFAPSDAEEGCPAGGRTL